MKHIDIRIHFIRDCVNRRLINVDRVAGIENPSDLLTKPLEKIIHFKWLHILGHYTRKPYCISVYLTCLLRLALMLR
jgi:hypothetical protein